MKECPKCKKMNSAYADRCKYCGFEIQWVPDDGTDYKAPPNFPPDENSKFQDSGGIKTGLGGSQDRASLEDIYEQLEDIKERMTSGVNLFDVTMPFGKMVILIIKLAFASIPAMLIMGLISSVFWLFFSSLFLRAMMGSYGMH
ncbi:hypothetical protein DESC_60002 [Desulfosarcina cetonica]|uniref:hypothetical protein n=1 Tax=Desulfosarcina cetonica TaxID=90730 RepID=UPI001BBE4CD7|nr:hypothetical protein [Desulfosarcina cetonica]VTR67262.1 hypothetical protein DESC_60002 [Desulfosarcina cetonica]